MSETQEAMKPTITIRGSKATVEVPTTKRVMNSTAARAQGLADDIVKVIQRGGYDYRRDGDLVELNGVRKPYRASKIVTICKAAGLPFITSPKSRTAIRLKKREERRLLRERLKAKRAAKPGSKVSSTLDEARKTYLNRLMLERSRLVVERDKAQKAIHAVVDEIDRIEEEIARMEAETTPEAPLQLRQAAVE